MCDRPQFARRDQLRGRVVHRTSYQAHRRRPARRNISATREHSGPRRR
jgi:hypothetical protein